MLPDMHISMDVEEYAIAQMAEQLGQTQVPEPTVTPKEAHLLLEQEFHRILMEALQADQFPEETESEDEPDFDGIVDEEVFFDMNSLENSEYYPYPDKTTMLLDVLDNLLRCCFIGAQLSLVIHFAKSLSAPNVPSLKGLRHIQKGCCKTISRQWKPIPSELTMLSRSSPVESSSEHLVFPQTIHSSQRRHHTWAPMRIIPVANVIGAIREELQMQLQLATKTFLVHNHGGYRLIM
ncbi:hypothetical protein C8R45DRAFT_934373 [Mycena sanguinolenta]|nr:hypothetical protein C8R45DRAFT_934373 [Mycena sanguinolenta]